MKDKKLLIYILLLYAVIATIATFSVGLYLGNRWSNDTSYNYTTETLSNDHKANKQIILTTEEEWQTFKRSIGQTGVYVSSLKIFDLNQRIYVDQPSQYPIGIEFNATSPHNINVPYGTKSCDVGWGEGILIAMSPFILAAIRLFLSLFFKFIFEEEPQINKEE